MREDAAQLAAVEAMLVATVLFGALLFVLYSPMPGDDEAIETAGVDEIAADLLRVLSGIPSDRDYASRLDETVSEALIGNTTGARALAHLLPAGAGYGLYLDNGVQPLTLYESGTPMGAVSSRDDLYYPSWDRLLAFADLEGHAGTSTSDTMRIRTFPLVNSYIDRTSSPVLLYENGVNVALSRDASGALVTAFVPPKTLVLDGYATPYDSTDFNDSVATHTLSPPTLYTVRTSLADVPSETAYRIHPSYNIDAGLRTYAEAGGHTSLSATSLRPGDDLTLTYDFSGMPLGSATVLGRTVEVHGPAPGLLLETASLTSATGTWTTTLPRDALYGTYVVDTQVVLSVGSLQQVVHDVTYVDVLRPGTDAPTPPVYRVALAVWFNGL